MNFAKQLVTQKVSRLKRQDEHTHELKRAELMVAVDLERGGTEGGFFPQVGTNLTTPDSLKKPARGTKKSVEKAEQSQQTSPILVSPGVKLPSPFNRLSSPALGIDNIRPSIIARATAMFRLGEPRVSQVKRKLLGQDTPGSPV